MEILIIIAIIILCVASIIGCLSPMMDRDVEMNFFTMLLALLPVVNTIIAIYMTDFKSIKKIFKKKE